MNDVQDIQTAVEKLPIEEFKAFETWFESFSFKVWDKEIKNDISNGTLDFLVNEAISEYEQGKTKEI